MAKQTNPESHRLNQPLPSKPPRTTKHHPIRWLITIIVLMSLSVGGYFTWQHFQNQLTTANSPIAIMNFNQDATHTNQLTMEYYYQPGCKDCQKVARTGIQNDLQAASRNNQVVTINTQKFKTAGSKAENAQAHQWFAANYITQTPTLIVKYHGKPIYLYSGTNIKTFRTLLKGENPKTHQAFKHQVPTNEIYQNDFDHSRQTFVSVDPLVK